MTKIVTIVSTSSKMTATANDDKYSYKVDYQLSNNGKTLDSVTVSVSEKNGNYAGSISLNGTSKNISAPETVDVNAINTMFDNIVAEIKAGLTV